MPVEVIYSKRDDKQKTYRYAENHKNTYLFYVLKKSK